MDSDKDLEKSLRNVDAGPGERVRRKVMSEYTAEFNGTTGKNFWYKAVPLYKAVAAAIMIALASALTGAWIAGSSGGEPHNAPTYVESGETISTAQLKPVIAENDAF